MGELLPCFWHSWSASYMVPFKPSGSFRVKAFFFQVSSLVGLSQLSPAAECYYSIYRIINGGPRVRRAEQEKLALKSYDVLPSPTTCHTALGASGGLGGRCIRNNKARSKAAEGEQSVKASLCRDIRFRLHQDPWTSQWYQNVVPTERSEPYAITFWTWKLHFIQEEPPLHHLTDLKLITVRQTHTHTINCNAEPLSLHVHMIAL